MTDQTHVSQSNTAQDAAGAFLWDARDRRAIAVAELLRSGWTGTEVSAGLKVIDAGGGVALAMEAMGAAREARRAARDSPVR